MSLHGLVLGIGKDVLLDVDHINGDKLDNRRQSLRFVTRKQNIAFKCPSKRSTSGFKKEYKTCRGNFEAKYTWHRNGRV